jgi:hypothetical protein
MMMGILPGSPNLPQDLAMTPLAGLNDDLRATFHRWYPGLMAAPKPAEEEAA